MYIVTCDIIIYNIVIPVWSDELLRDLLSHLLNDMTSLYKYDIRNISNEFEALYSNITASVPFFAPNNVYITIDMHVSNITNLFKEQHIVWNYCGVLVRNYEIHEISNYTSHNMQSNQVNISDNIVNTSSYHSSDLSSDKKEYIVQNNIRKLCVLD